MAGDDETFYIVKSPVELIIAGVISSNTFTSTESFIKMTKLLDYIIAAFINQKHRYFFLFFLERISKFHLIVACLEACHNSGVHG